MINMSKRLQSAMEYLITYGWAILVIAVVLGVLYSLGIFSPSNFAPKAQPGNCQVFRPNGPGTSYDANLEGTCSGELPQYAAQFNGETSFITVENAKILAINGSISIQAWVNANPVSSIGIVTKGPPSGGYDYMMYISGAGTGTTDLYLTNSTGHSSTSPLVYVYVGNWHQVVVSFNSSNSMFYAYLDGELKGSAKGGLSDIRETSNSLLIGKGWAGSFNGLLSNIQIYNTSISSNEVQSLYQEGIGGAPANLQYLVGWWPLNGNANDYSGNNNDGISSNVVYTGTWQRGYTAP